MNYYYLLSAFNLLSSRSCSGVILPRSGFLENTKLPTLRKRLQVFQTTGGFDFFSAERSLGGLSRVRSYIISRTYAESMGTVSIGNAPIL
jgi:hypothetical protein